MSAILIRESVSKSSLQRFEPRELHMNMWLNPQVCFRALEALVTAEKDNVFIILIVTNFQARSLI